MTTIDTQQPIDADLDDAIPGRIVIEAGPTLALEFSHLAVYYPKRDGGRAMWSFRAVLRCESVSTLDIKLEKDLALIFTTKDFVGNYTIVGASGDVHSEQDVLRGIGAARVWLLFSGSGTQISIAAKRVKLELVECLHHVQDFDDP